MQATRQDVYLHFGFARLNSIVTTIFSLAVAVCIAGTFLSAFSRLPI